MKLTAAPLLSVPLIVAVAPASICSAPVSVSVPARVTEPASSIVTRLPAAPAVRFVSVAAPVTFRVPAPLTVPVSAFEAPASVRVLPFSARTPAPVVREIQVGRIA